MKQHTNQCSIIEQAHTRFDGIGHMHTEKIITTCNCWCHK
jgi:hypothetical protein